MIYINILLFISVSNWNGWTNWGSCSQECGGGSQSRSRTCPGNCSGGSGSETRDCNTSPCGECNMYNPCTLACGSICHHFWFLCKFFPTCLVSNWNGWSNWGSCSKDCGGGSQSRSRTCPGNCVGGSASESRTCNSNQCGMLILISITCKPALTCYLGKTEQFIHFCLLSL